VSSPAEMPQRRPVHPVRPPLEHRDRRPVPQWHCPKRPYRTQAEADEALTEIWSAFGRRLGGRPMEAHTYRCPRHGTRTVWHLTSQDQEGRAS
jgi:hypothetical protein